MDRYMMSGHKLWWHLDRVVAWQKGERIVPLHMDIGISRGCTIGCVYCYGVTQGRIGPKGPIIPREPLIRFMKDAAKAGVKAISITGEAEPTMNPAVYDAVVEGSNAGLSLGLATWGGLIDKQRICDLAEHLTWIRFNISAGSAESYQRIHRTVKENFDRVIRNIGRFVELKRQRNLPVTVGLQMVTMPWYAEEAVRLGELGRTLGVDYLEIKHCSDTPDGKLGVRYEDYRKVEDILRQAELMSTDTYDVIVRWDKILKGNEREYDVCNCAGNFMLRMSGSGTVYPCAQFFEDRREEFAMGSIVEQPFSEIISGDRYRQVMEKVQKLDVHRECYSGCKENAINEFLWKLKHPVEHLNFV